MHGRTVLDAGSIRSAEYTPCITSGLVSAAVFQEKIRGSKGIREKFWTETCMMFPGWSPSELVETSVAALVEFTAGG